MSGEGDVILPKPSRRVYITGRNGRGRFGPSRERGHSLARLTYLDEAGTSSGEPYLVVAAVIAHVDLQLRAVEEHLNALGAKHVPEQKPHEVIFHATDIWSGGKKFKDRTRWPLPKRLALLEDLADIPAKFGLPVAIGEMRKGPHLAGVEVPENIADIIFHSAAFINATQAVERYFRHSFPNEYTLLIAEDRPKMASIR
jgi:hypothetical protein